MVFVARIIRHDLCIFWFVLFKNHFDQDLFPYCWHKFDYPGSIVYLSCSVVNCTQDALSIVLIYHTPIFRKSNFLHLLAYMSALKVSGSESSRASIFGLLLETGFSRIYLLENICRKVLYMNAQIGNFCALAAWLFGHLGTLQSAPSVGINQYIDFV